VLPKKYLAEMGHICVNATNVLRLSNDGVPNTNIPKPGAPGQIDKKPAHLLWYHPHMLPYVNLQPTHRSSYCQSTHAAIQHLVSFPPTFLPPMYDASIWYLSATAASQQVQFLAVPDPQATTCSWVSYVLG